MKIEEKEDCIMYFLESFQDFIEFKRICKEKDEKIREFKKTKPYECINPRFVAAESGENTYGNRLMIPFDDVIEFMEELPIERIEDAKTIQLMLYELVGDRCSKKDFNRIGNAIKKKSARKEVNIYNGNYAENIIRQNNNYGRKRK